MIYEGGVFSERQPDRQTCLRFDPSGREFRFQHNFIPVHSRVLAGEATDVYTQTQLPMAKSGARFTAADNAETGDTWSCETMLFPHESMTAAGDPSRSRNS